MVLLTCRSQRLPYQKKRQLASRQGRQTLPRNRPSPLPPFPPKRIVGTVRGRMKMLFRLDGYQFADAGSHPAASGCIKHTRVNFVTNLPFIFLVLYLCSICLCMHDGPSHMYCSPRLGFVGRLVHAGRLSNRTFFFF